MKLVVGIGSADTYPQAVKAGADEVFCGFVPFDMVSVYAPINRREVRAANAQLGSESELRILAAMQKDLQVPIAIAFNALCYSPELLEKTGRTIAKCMEYGFRRVIVADPALLVWLDSNNIRPLIHISGEIGEINRYVISECRALNASRVIFHRKMSIEDMKACVHSFPDMEYEAFAMNEACHFHGGFCNTLHCDLLRPMCREPYHLDDMELPDRFEDPESPGSSGCAVCALWKLREAGITHLKIVGRGNFPELTVRDTEIMRKALSVLNNSSGEKEYIAEVRELLFSNGCSGSCYYR